RPAQAREAKTGERLRRRYRKSEMSSQNAKAPVLYPASMWAPQLLKAKRCEASQPIAGGSQTYRRWTIHRRQGHLVGLSHIRGAPHVDSRQRAPSIAWALPYRKDNRSWGHGHRFSGERSKAESPRGLEGHAPAPGLES